MWIYRDTVRILQGQKVRQGIFTQSKGRNRLNGLVASAAPIRLLHHLARDHRGKIPSPGGISMDKKRQTLRAEFFAEINNRAQSVGRAFLRAAHNGHDCIYWLPLLETSVQLALQIIYINVTIEVEFNAVHIPRTDARDGYWGQ